MTYTTEKQTGTQFTLFSNVRLMLPDRCVDSGWILLEQGKIHSLGEKYEDPGIHLQSLTTWDCAGWTVLPGFIDPHTHGALGSDFNTGSEEDMFKISNYFAQHGVSGFLATLYSSTPAEMEESLNTIQKAIGREPGAKILGVHLEGPWLNPLKAGAQSKETIRIAKKEEVLPYLESGLIRLVTLAPEIIENRWLIEECKKRGIAISAGHTIATYAEMENAVAMGVTQVTHCYNAMSPILQREPGTTGAALYRSDITCELIADLIHVHPVMIDFVLRMKGAQAIMLITDSIAAAGMPDGQYTLEGQQVTVAEGVARLVDDTLAGSTLCMDAALRNFLKVTNGKLEELWPCTSLNSARSLHLDGRKGKIQPGYDADLVFLDSNLHVKLTVAKGQICFDFGR